MRNRLYTGAGLFLLALAGFFALLWQLQVTAGAAYFQKSQRSIAQIEEVPAARGKLLDRTGKILAQDRGSWSLLPEEDCPDLTRLGQLCREEGIAWTRGEAIPNAPARLLARVREEDLEGIRFQRTVRREGSGTLAPHLLGRVGAMSEREWQAYEPLGYALDDTVGKEGAEQAFESLLHGTPGTLIVERDRSGRITNRSYAQKPQPGQDVTLTLDVNLQEALQEVLTTFLSENPQASAISAVVLDVRDGGVLAMASLPGYDTETFSTEYETLSQDPAHPLLNRAMQGLYAPGSTFKLVTAAAALEEGIVTPETEILDTGRYTYYKTPQPQCWLYREEGRTHGLETLSQALADSCNVYFFDAGRRLGIQSLNRYARAFGLGEKTGIELSGEQTGVVAGPEYTEGLGQKWYEGSVLSAAIGQENNRFTPLQLAHMTATLVGGGERRQVHLLKKSGGEEYKPQILGRIPLARENLEAIKAGMLSLTREGSLATAFRGLSVEAGAKTGSAQVAGEEYANGVLVAFAPYDEPEIALAVVAEQGGSGSALGWVAAEVMGAWFGG